MQISALFQLMGGDGTELYKYARKQALEVVVNDAIKQYIPALHDVADKGLRPDKTIFVATGIDPVTKQTEYGMEFAPVSRVPLAFQKYIIGQKGSFARGNGVILKPSIPEDPTYLRVQRNWTDNKTDFDLKEFAVRQMSETQVAAIMYGERGAEKLDDFRFKYKIISPMKGDVLEPFFDDDTDDLIAFGREYKRGKKTLYDLYTINSVTKLVEIHKFENKKPVMVMSVESGEAERRVIKTKYTKLPIIYWDLPQGECTDTEDLMKEMEVGFSDFLSGLGYTADPILFAKGKTMDLPAKGTQGKFIETEDPEGDLKFVTPDNATEARALQFKMLQKYIFTLNRSVLLDIETLTGLGVAASGAALERYLLDVYMEATDRQQGSWGKGIQRMINWMTHEWYKLDPGTEGVRIDAVFTRYSLQDDLERLNLTLKANGNKPVIDMETAVGMSGLVDDVKAVTGKIKQETAI